MSNPNIFQYQSNSDIILRTYDSTQINKIIIGNTSSNEGPNRTGAMYVCSNNVGFRKVPSSNIAADVNGTLAATNVNIASNLVVGYGSNPGTVTLLGTSDLLVKNSNNVVSFQYSNTERIKLTNGIGLYVNDTLYTSNETIARGLIVGSNLGYFHPTRCNSEIFTDSLDKDILIRANANSQRMLFGFSSNGLSTMTLSKSNLSMMKSSLTTSNIGIGTDTPPSGYSLYVSGDTRIEGNVTVNGTMTQMNTDVQVTDQFTVSNAGTGPALVVIQTGTQPIAEFRDDDKIVMKIYDSGFVSIGSNPAATKLDVEGSATIRGTIYTSNVSTSNVQTSSLTTNLFSALTTVTSNLRTSNVIVNNQVIIGSNGVITSSNFIPPLNTSNIVTGQFSSNFILNDNVLSSKLASNLTLKGVTTMTSNVYVQNGNITVLGDGNFEYVGDQARLHFGSNDYFIGASKGVGIVMQVPGTTYPFVLENTTGNIGIGTMDPEESLQVTNNVKVMGSQFVMQNIGVGTSNPSVALDVSGDIAATQNIKSSVGTLGPCFSLIPESAYADVSVNNSLILDNTLEAGNPANNTNKALFYGSSFLYQDCSGENMQWNSARILFRGCPLTTYDSTSVFTVQDFVYNRNPQYGDISPQFTLYNDGSDFGYVTYSTPWFSMESANPRHIALSYISNSENADFRVGQVLIQFKS